MSRTDAETDTFSAEERAAIKERAKELKAAKSKKVDPLEDLLEKIAALPDDDRALAEHIHRIVTETAPHLTPRTYYGMPAWAKDGKVLCFFQPKSKFKVRYGTLGFETTAGLDDGAMWPTAFAVTAIGPAEEERIRELVRRAAG
jgi:uncharacterized protein YdhG (YjbR/CyaY superfamily)